MKIIKKIFSRTVLIALLLLLQIAFVVGIVLVVSYVNALWANIITIAVYVVSFLVCLRIIDKKIAPDFKVPWIVLLLALPLFGILIWVFFGNHGMRKKYSAALVSAYEKTTKYVNVTEEETEQFKNEAGKYYGTLAYLRDTTGTRAYKNSKITYYKTGELFFPEFLETLKKAKKFILMEFFIINYGKEWNLIHDVLVQKVKEGVEVRLLYDDIGCIGTLKNGYWKTLREEGIKCLRFNPFRPILSGVFNNRDHRKIAVIDHQYAWTGGINLADEYANDIVRFGYWKDAMVKVEGPAIAGFIQMFLLIYDLMNGSLSDFDFFHQGSFQYFENDSLSMPFGDAPSPFINDLVGEQTFINLISSATKTVYISSPYLIPTYNLTSALINASRRGVDVRVMVPGIPDKTIVWWMAKSHFRELHEAGVKMIVYDKGFNHEKALVVDNEIAFIGTINLDYRSLVHHFECGIIMYKTEAINDINEDLLSCFKESTYYNGENFKLNIFQRIICFFVNIFAPLL